MKLIAIGLCGLALVGCINVPPRTTTVGRDIDKTKVDKIQKGTTTAKEIESVFGSPDMKSTVSATEEKWVYNYTTVTSSASGSAFNPDIKTSGTKKMLDLFVKDGVVINYAYTEGPNEVQVK